MTKLTKSINKITHDRHRNDNYDDRRDDRYDDRHDGHNQDIVMVIEKKEIGMMKTMVRVEKV